MPPADEQDYLRALRARDPLAWDQAFRELWGVALGAARRGSGVLSPPDIEDAAAEALEKLVDQVDRVGSREELRMWTATISYRCAISMARRKAALKRGFGLLVEGDAFLAEANPELNALPPDATGLRDLEIAELAKLLQGYLAQLDSDTRELLFEKVILGMTYAEMSQKHGRPIGSMCSKVARGLQAVRQLMGDSPVDAKEFQAYLR